jgi:polyphenol oxidase
MKLLETPFGDEFTFGPARFFFGNKTADFSSLQKSYPHLHFTKLKQVHGSDLVESKKSDSGQTADAHYSFEKNHALCSITADCIPILMFSEKRKPFVAAIHAGWRGIAARIVPLVIDHFFKLDYQARDLNIFAGPHIQKNSFEVGNDVKDQILKSIQQPSEVHWQPISKDKSRVDLHQILKDQIHEFAIPGEQLFFMHIDTYQNQNYHSFRRDKEAAGRQISFIYME